MLICTHPSCILLSNTQSRGQATQSLRVFIFYTVYKTRNRLRRIKLYIKKIRSKDDVWQLFLNIISVQREDKQDISS